MGYMRDIFKLYLVVGLGCVLLTVSLYLFGFKPLTDRLRAEHYNEIRHFVDSGSSLLKSVLDRHADLARQSASRTAIRKKQIAYLNSEVSKDDFVAFSAPKLADAMDANQDIVGIQRYGPDGEQLFSVGLAPPEDAEQSCRLKSSGGVRMLGLMELGGANRLLYCSPIIDREAGNIGADILVMDDAGIESVVDNGQSGLGNLAIVSDGSIIYWPHHMSDTYAHTALEACLAHGCSSKFQLEQDYIFDSRTIDQTGWRLYAVVNSKDFFSGINLQLVILLGVVTLVTVFVFALTVIALRPVIRALLREKQLLELSHHDGLTGMYNHTYMQILLERELERHQRHGRVFSLLMFDVDRFKKVNDSFGHQAGDAVLKRVSEVVSKSIRKIDMAARYGGEEFLVIMPETGSSEAFSMTERLRISIEQASVMTSHGEVAVTMSAGVVTCDFCDENYTSDQLIEVVDKALYESKRNGRNQVSAVVLSKSL